MQCHPLSSPDTLTQNKFHSDSSLILPLCALQLPTLLGAKKWQARQETSIAFKKNVHIDPQLLRADN